jgi:hypothetical protein
MNRTIGGLTKTVSGCTLTTGVCPMLKFFVDTVTLNGKKALMINMPHILAIGWMAVLTLAAWLRQ